MTKMTKRNITGKKKGLGRYIKRRKTLTSNKSILEICAERIEELKQELREVGAENLRPTFQADYKLANTEYQKAIKAELK